MWDGKGYACPFFPFLPSRVARILFHQINLSILSSTTPSSVHYPPYTHSRGTDPGNTTTNIIVKRGRTAEQAIK
jgi:hypothetical protein